MDEYWVGVLTNMGLIAFLATSAYLLLIAGELSFGQQAFFGVGAYAGGAGTAMFGWPLPVAALGGAIAGAFVALLVGLCTLRLRGLYFGMATLAAAEMLRIALELLHWSVEVDGVPVGPDGAQGFRGIRWVFEQGIEPVDFLVLVWSMLVTVGVAFALFERSRLGATVRAVGDDPELASAVGIRVGRIKLGIVTAAGALAALGGVLFAHHNTYVEPRNFDLMLGVHALSYALIGGLGTVLGPIVGVVLDIGVLEGSRVLQSYRMIVFGGLVAVLLTVRPRGLLNEQLVHRIVSALRARHGKQA